MKLGTRNSPLALMQADIVNKLLREKATICPYTTSGDRLIDKKLSDLGIKGIFTKELEYALLNGEIDFAVHSLKDMPAEMHNELEIIAYLKRDDPADILVGYNSLNEIKNNVIIGTSSLRREYFLKKIFPECEIRPIRGNIGTRIDKIGKEVDCIVLSKSGLDRMQIIPEKSYVFSLSEMIPAAAQGIIAIQVHKNCAHKNILRQLNDGLTESVAIAERSFLKGWERQKFAITNQVSSSCRVPIAANAVTMDDKIYFNYMASYNNKSIIRNHKVNIKTANSDIFNIGMNLAKEILE